MSTPKEKANELVDKMHNSEHCGIKHFPNKKYCECVEMNLFQAKQCALIAVDEKINLFKQIILDFHLDENEKALNIYRELKEVKQEIQKLS